MSVETTETGMTRRGKLSSQATTLRTGKRFRFTIYHGFALSLVLHGLFTLPIILHKLIPPPEPPSMLEIELEGVTSDSQTKKKVMEETKGDVKQNEQQAAKPEEATVTPPPEPPPPEDKQEVPPDPKDAIPVPEPPKPEAVASPSAEAQKAGAAGSQDIKGEQEQQIAQALKRQHDAELSRLKQYVRLLSKKVQSHVILPQGHPQGVAVVSFTITSDGQVRADSLKIVESSGSPQLDAGAMQTILASVPFDVPPRQMTVAIDVVFRRSH